MCAGLVQCLTLLFKSVSLPVVFLPHLSVTERAVLKSTSKIVILSLFPFNSVRFGIVFLKFCFKMCMCLRSVCLYQELTHLSLPRRVCHDLTCLSSLVSKVIFFALKPTL